METNEWFDPQHAILKLPQVINDLEKVMAQYAKAMGESARAEVAYKKERSKVMLLARFETDLKTVGDKTAWADTRIEKEYETYVIAEAAATVYREKLRVLMGIMTGLQSLNRTFQVATGGQA